MINGTAPAVNGLFWGMDRKKTDDGLYSVPEQAGGMDRKDSFFRYLTWSGEDERWRIFCTTAGFTDISPGVPYPPRKHEHPAGFSTVAVGRTLNEYQIVYITRGNGVLESMGRCYDIVPGSIMVIFPGVQHFYRPAADTGWTEYWVGFRGDHADSLCREGFLSPDRPLYIPGLRNAILEHYTRLLELVREQGPLYQLKAGALVLGLVAEILACERRSVQSSRAEELVTRAKTLMHENIEGEITLNAIAESLGVSTSVLNDAFKSYTAMTPYQYFISIRLNRAKELLERDIPVKEVAWKLGFSDEYYFSRLFKHKTGISPSRWKPWERLHPTR